MTIQQYRAAIEIDPEFSEALYGVGDALHDLSKTLSGDAKAEKLQEAVAAFRELVRIHPKYADGFNTLGIVLEDAGDIQGAVESYRKATESDPTLTMAQNNLARARKELGDFDDDGIACFEDSDRTFAIMMFLTAITSGDIEKAETALRRDRSYVTASSMGVPVLCQAAKEGELESVQLLVAYGADIDEEDDGGDNAFHNANCYGHSDICSFLTRAGHFSDSRERMKFAMDEYQNSKERKLREKQREEQQRKQDEIKPKQLEGERINQRIPDKQSNASKNPTAGCIIAIIIGLVVIIAFASINYSRNHSSGIQQTQSTSGNIKFLYAKQSMNIRSGPSTKKTVVDTLRRGETVTVIGYSNGWAQISYRNGKAGWVWRNYLRN